MNNSILVKRPNQEVIGLKIPVNDTQSMKIMQGMGDLNKVIAKEEQLW